MCMMALGAVLSIAQAAVGFASAQQQADEQNAYYEQNRRAAVAAMTDRYASINNKNLQEREAASAELFEKRIAGLKAKSTAITSAGEAGVTGLSVANLMQDVDAQMGRQAQAIQTNFEIKRQHNADELVATHHNAISRINSVRQASGPNPLAFALQGIGGALGAFSKSGAV